MKILHLTLKKKWFDMILSGEKVEEYREIKAYWANKLCLCYGEKQSMAYWKGFLGKSPSRMIQNEAVSFIQFDQVKFKNGYSKNAREMTLEFIEFIEVGYPVPSWSDNSKNLVFSIPLGKIISTKNIK